MSNLDTARSLALLDLLPPAVATKLKSASTLVRYSDGQLIQTRGSTRSGLSVIASGAAKVGVNSVDGVFVMTALLGPGECFGEFTLFTDLPRTHDISARGNTAIYQLSSARFNQLYEQEPELSRALLQVSLLRTHILLETLDAMRRLPILERTAQLLLTMSITSGSQSVIDCRQVDLAFSLGVTRVSLGKALATLSELGLVVPAYGKIKLPDYTRLVDWVSENCGTTPL